MPGLPLLRTSGDVYESLHRTQCTFLRAVNPAQPATGHQGGGARPGRMTGCTREMHQADGERVGPAGPARFPFPPLLLSGQGFNLSPAWTPARRPACPASRRLQGSRAGCSGSSGCSVAGTRAAAALFGCFREGGRWAAIGCFEGGWNLF